jgi:hypothetical protein
MIVAAGAILGQLTAEHIAGENLRHAVIYTPDGFRVEITGPAGASVQVDINGIPNKRRLD